MRLCLLPRLPGAWTASGTNEIRLELPFIDSCDGSCPRFNLKYPSSNLAAANFWTTFRWCDDVWRPSHTYTSLMKSKTNAYTGRRGRILNYTKCTPTFKKLSIVKRSVFSKNAEFRVWKEQLSVNLQFIFQIHTQNKITNFSEKWIDLMIYFEPNFRLPKKYTKVFLLHQSQFCLPPQCYFHIFYFFKM